MTAHNDGAGVTPPAETDDHGKAKPAPEPAARRRSARRGVRLARGGGAAVVQDEWMLTYMDTVTLLVTLFVLLLSFSNIDEDKYKAVANGLSLSNYGSGILLDGLGQSTSREIGSTAFSMPGDVPPTPTLADRYQSVGVELIDSFSESGLADLVGVTVRNDTVDLVVNERVLFALGSAELTGQGATVVERLAPFLKERPVSISVEGHTDNLPISTETFPSNWQLSSARASSVAQHLIANGIEPTRVRVVGYADTRPVTDNDTATSRQQNRRVSIRLSLGSDWPPTKH